MVIGQHFIKGWARPQTSVTQSSADAELVAMFKLSADILGIISLAKDLGIGVKGTVYADRSAALAIAKRKGSGKLRDVSVGLLWVHEKQGNYFLRFEQVGGLEAPQT